MFHIRLKEYRTSKNLNKRQMANHLKISESYYNLLENGKRTPSKMVLYKLVLDSNMPEEFWLYGITSNNELLVARKDFKCTYTAFEFCKDLKELNENTIVNLFKHLNTLSSIENLFLKALKADLQHLYEKTKNNIK